MAITDTERAEIINAVLAGLRSSALLIENLTQVDQIADDDLIEISGGRCVRFSSIQKIVDDIIIAGLEETNNTITDNRIKKIEATSDGVNLMVAIETGKKTFSCAVPFATGKDPGVITAKQFQQIEKIEDLEKNIGDVRKRVGNIGIYEISQIAETKEELKHATTDMEGNISFVYGEGVFYECTNRAWRVRKVEDGVFNTEIKPGEWIAMPNAAVYRCGGVLYTAQLSGPETVDLYRFDFDLEPEVRALKEAMSKEMKPAIARATIVLLPTEEALDELVRFGKYGDITYDPEQLYGVAEE